MTSCVLLTKMKSVILLLLDLSAAFDTVDHSILLSRLHDRFGVNGTAAAWFESYLTSRTQFVRVNDCRSTQRSLERGVPQGSVVGPLLYLLYASPIADIIKFHKLQYHLYADDTRLYISLRTDRSYDLSLAKRRVECCVNDIDCWMVNNGLKLNQDKTELVLISSKFRCRPSLRHYAHHAQFLQMLTSKPPYTFERKLKELDHNNPGGQVFMPQREACSHQLGFLTPKKI